MAASFVQFQSNDKAGQVRDLISFHISNPGSLNGSVEYIGSLPASGIDGRTLGNGWELVAAEVGALVNTTHDNAESITATVEKTDGGTSMLATAPVITAASGTGPQNSSDGGTEDVRGVAHAAEANRRLADYSGFIVTLTEAGSGGTDPSDVYAVVTFARIQNFDPGA